MPQLFQCQLSTACRTQKHWKLNIPAVNKLLQFSLFSRATLLLNVTFSIKRCYCRPHLGNSSYNITYLYQQKGFIFSIFAPTDATLTWHGPDASSRRRYLVFFQPGYDKLANSEKKVHKNKDIKTKGQAAIIFLSSELLWSSEHFFTHERLCRIPMWPLQRQIGQQAKSKNYVSNMTSPM